MKTTLDINQSFVPMTHSAVPHGSKSIPSWQQELAQGFSSLFDLFSYLELDISALPIDTATTGIFPFKVTREFASRIKKGDINDPLLKQVLPIPAESINPFDFVDNPVGDIEAVALPGVLHKYVGRALLIVTGGCAINCRYCFRRNFPYTDTQLTKQKRAGALQYIKNCIDIKEIILSGGDPLIQSNQQLGDLIKKIEGISHVHRLRIHSRLPNVLPSRIDSEFLKMLSDSRLKSVVVVHINHPNELDQQVKAAISRFHHANIPVFNQAVLLRGVNDNAETLTTLCETLFDAGVLPYYLHVLDKAKGTHHFNVSVAKCKKLQDTLRSTLPGYLIPRFVTEQAGKAHKIPL